MPVNKRSARGNVHGWVVVNAKDNVLFNFDSLFSNKSNPCYQIFNTGSGNNNACRRYLKSGGASNKNLRNGLKTIRNIRRNEQNRKAGLNKMANDTHERIIRWFDKMLIIVTPPPKMASPLGFVPRALMKTKK